MNGPASDAESVFGPAPEKLHGWSQVDDLFEAIAEARGDQDAVERFIKCVSIARDLEKRAFASAVEIAAQDVDVDDNAEWARGFFHSAVEYGETRMLAKALSNLLDYVTGKSATLRLQ